MIGLQTLALQSQGAMEDTSLQNHPLTCHLMLKKGLSSFAWFLHLWFQVLELMLSWELLSSDSP